MLSLGIPPSNHSTSHPLQAWPARASAAGDELWWDGFGLPSIDGLVRCTAEYQGSIVAGGYFTQAGGRLVSNIARWDGARWEPLEGGTVGGPGTVAALTVFEGDLVAAGWFQDAGGVTSYNIARWNGQTWSSMGEGLHGLYPSDYALVLALAIHEGTLIAGGYFSHSGGTETANIARWNGASWEPIGEGVEFMVEALAVKSGDLYAGGRQELYGTHTAGLTRWNGTSWDGLGMDVYNTTSTGDVQALHVHDDLLIVGGHFDHAGGLPASNVAGWNGSAWVALGTGIEDGLHSVTTTADGTLYAGGWGLHVWNGESWNTVPEVEGSVFTVRSIGDDLLAGGNIEVSSAGDVRAFALARRSNGTWSGLEPWTDRMHGLTLRGSNPSIGALGTHQGKLVAMGSFHHAGDPPSWDAIEQIAEWDGDTWLKLPPLPASDDLREVLEMDGALHVLGSFLGPDPLLPIIPVVRLVGSEWQPLAASTFNPRAMIVYEGALHVVARDNSHGYGNVYRYSGSTWQLIGSAAAGAGYAFPTITSIVELNGRLVIAGKFQSVNGVPALNVATWDGAQWEQFGTGLPVGAYGRVDQLAAYRGTLIASGTLSVPGANPETPVRWNGSRWEPMGTLLAWIGSEGPVTAGDELFLIGFLFWPQDPDRYDGVARWDGHDWVPLGSGTNGPIWAILAHQGSVYMGGSFNWAGGKSAFGMARWDGPLQTSSAPSLAPAAPNPFMTSTSLTYRTSQAGSVRISVYDAMGREIAVLDQSSRSPGVYAATWNGRDRNGNPAPAGVYFIRAALPGNADYARKVVRLR